MFKVKIDGCECGRKEVVIETDENTDEISVDICLIIRAVYGSVLRDDKEKEMFKMFVEDGLGKIALAEPEKIEKEKRRVQEILESEKKGRKELADALLKDELVELFIQAMLEGGEDE